MCVCIFIPISIIISVFILFSAISGEYACITTIMSLPYIIRQSITIQQYPSIQVTSDKTLKCEDTTIPLTCCAQNIYPVQWADPAICNSVPQG